MELHPHQGYHHPGSHPLPGLLAALALQDVGCPGGSTERLRAMGGSVSARDREVQEVQEAFLMQD